MSNMSYCRFQNTLADLRDCKDNMLEGELSRSEHEARLALLRMCKDIAETDEDDLPPFEEEENEEETEGE